MKALDKIARHPELQPSARRDVAGALMQLDALEDVISLVERPCDVNRGTKSGAFDYPHDLETSLAAVTLLASVLPKMNGVDAIPDEEQLEVEAVRAVRNSVVDGKVLLRLAHQESHRLIRILLLSGEVVDGGNFRYPRLLTETCFTLARIASTTRTAHAVFRAGAVRALAIVIRVLHDFPRSIANHALKETTIDPRVQKLLASPLRTQDSQVYACSYDDIARSAST